MACILPRVLNSNLESNWMKVQGKKLKTKCPDLREMPSWVHCICWGSLLVLITTCCLKLCSLLNHHKLLLWDWVVEALVVCWVNCASQHVYFVLTKRRNKIQLWHLVLYLKTQTRFVKKVRISKNLFFSALVYDIFIKRNCMMRIIESTLYLATAKIQPLIRVGI